MIESVIRKVVIIMLANQQNTTSRAAWKAGRHSGQMLTILAIMLVAILAILGLVVDVGLLEANRRHAQRAADAAAQAGARELLNGASAAEQASARAAALNLAGINGSATNNNVLIEIPPAATSGSAYAGSNSYVRVEVTRPVDPTFIRLLLLLDLVNVRATATAGVRPRPITAAVWTLDPNDRAALKVSGQGQMWVRRGTIQVDSNDPRAVTIAGGGTIVADVLGVTGGVDNPEAVQGTVITGLPPGGDPFATMQLPQITSKDGAVSGDGASIGTSPDSEGTAKKPAVTSPNGVKTLRPGVYWGGIVVNANATITLSPGLYIMAGGGFSVTGSDSNVAGTGVVIYNTNDPYAKGGAAAVADCNWTGGTLNLVAPTEAQAGSTPGLSLYKGFLIINDRASTTTTKIAGQSALGGETPLRGYIYSPNGTVAIRGGSGSAGLGVVAGTISITGGGTFGVDNQVIPDVATVTLVE
ncbi:MAG: hypothetical protein FJ388_04750 [Verrucomicrobia bacterium]|nr:hypothetical protein [Verrucomicrobiota bacterium]